MSKTLHDTDTIDRESMVVEIVLELDLSKRIGRMVHTSCIRSQLCKLIISFEWCNKQFQCIVLCRSSGTETRYDLIPTLRLIRTRLE